MYKTLDDFRKELGDSTLTEEQIRSRFLEEKRKFDNDVNNIVDGYEKLDKSELVNGKLVDKKECQTRENLEEWKKGFMDGFEEAYKRLMGNKS